MTDSNASSELSFCATDAASLEQWTADLPLVNTPETARLLVQATSEVGNLSCPPQDRLALLEVIRPTVRYICTRIDRSTLGKSTKNAEASPHAMHRNMCHALGVTFDQTLVAMESEKPPSKDLLARVGHRLMTELAHTILRCFQYYVPVPDRFWAQLHSAFTELERRELLDYKLKDEEGSTRDLTILETYLRVLLLQTCKPNKLNHMELTHLFNALEGWCMHATLNTPVADAIFAVDLASNRPPLFSALQRDSGTLRGLRTEVLAYELEAYLNAVSTSVAMPENIETGLIEHAVAAWGSMHPREFKRVSTETPLKLSIGLRATHYFLSGGVDFNDQVTNAETFLRREVNPFLEVDYESVPKNDQQDDDPWSQAHDLKVKIPENPNIESPDKILLAAQQNQAAPERKYDHYELVAVDTSPNGYRVRWGEDVPREAQVGELIALREESDSRWCVAIIRWISKTGEFAEMGVELLSPKAIPVAIRPILKKGGSAEFQRALILPGLDGIEQPSTMITPKLPFHEQQKISIQRQGLQTTGLLMDLAENTQSFNQFTFRVLDGYLESSGAASSMAGLSAMNREDTTRGP